MADKSPPRSLRQRDRQDAQREASGQGARAQDLIEPDRDAGSVASVVRAAGCWYGDPAHRPAVGWCPSSCHGPVTHSERTGQGDQLVYCEAHAHWRRRTIRLPLVRRMRPGE
jgi:hypothetical protein